MSEHDHDKKIHKCPTEGENYDSPQTISLAKETTDIIKQQINLPKDAIILDFGAGTGLLGLNFINEAKHVIFQDVSNGMLDYLQYKCDTQGIKNYTIFNGIMEDFKSEEKVDLILAGMVLHHIEDLKSLFNKFLEMLKPKGYICITDLVKDAPMFNIGGHKHQHVMPHKGFDAEELCENIKKWGCVTTEIKKVSSIIFKGMNGEEVVSERFMIIAQGP